MKKVTIHKHEGKCLNPAAVRIWFDAIPDGDYTLSYKNASTCSKGQRGYYRGVVCEAFVELLREIGWDWIRHNDDAHEYLKEKFLRVPVIDDEGTVQYYRTKSTEELDPKEYNEYLEACRKHAAEDFGHYIAEPNEQAKLWQH